MAITYTKKLKSITITLLDGSTVTMADTVESADASLALASLQGGGGAYNGSTWIPVTSVLSVEVTESDSDEITKDVCES